MVQVMLPFFNAPSSEGGSLTHYQITSAAIGCPVFRDDAVLVHPLISQNSAAPPTAHPNDGNAILTVLLGLCRISDQPKNCTTYGQQWNEHDRSPSWVVEVSNVTTRACLALCTI